MKKTLNAMTFGIIVFMLSIMASCSGDKHKGETISHEDHATANDEEVVVQSPQFEVDKAFQDQLANVFTEYIGLKDAFVDSQVELVKKEASSLIQAVAKVDMKLVTGAAHNDWMAFLSPIQKSLNEIQGSTDIEEQRRSFSTLSDNLYKSIRAFGLGGKEAYYEYCPMAFNNEGAYWLSDEEKIRNPYFGEKMLTCGTVKEKLK